MKPLISFLMTTYNDMGIFPMAVASLQSQTFSDWELLILDNSETKEPWETLQKYEVSDARIRIFKSDHNIGWAKGTAELLPKAQGEYMTFLAADDFINADTLDGLAEVLERESPDVAFVGNAFTRVDQNLEVEVLGGNCPIYHVYDKKRRSECIFEVLQSAYYNTMFHYCKISFLREFEIDFYEPFYGDCGGMTAALCKASKVLTYDRVIYLLSMNTSQTYGKYTWDFYKVISQQWQNVSEVFLREKFEDDEKIRFVAEKIFDNFVGNLDILLNDGICRDKKMNLMQVTQEDRKKQVREMMQDEGLMDLFDYLGQMRLKEALMELV